MKKQLGILSWCFLAPLMVLMMGAKAEMPSGKVDRTASALPGMPYSFRAVPLKNLVQVHPKLISGSSPNGETAFAKLRSMGVKTIISVDGAKPDVQVAKKYGLRYVHLPHGYDGISTERQFELAKAVRDLEGPIYLHCHHGKHRSPVAAAVACVTVGWLEKSEALAVLEIAGTSPNYKGLYQTVQEAVPLGEEKLNGLQVEFYETVAIPPLAEAMVVIEETHDHLKAIAAADWQTPVEQPDLNPAHEALMLREHFTELLRTRETKRHTNAFRELLAESMAEARSLEEALRTDPIVSETKRVRYQKSFTQITKRCSTCHQSFRDQPTRLSLK